MEQALPMKSFSITIFCPSLYLNISPVFDEELFVGIDPVMLYTIITVSMYGYRLVTFLNDNAAMDFLSQADAIPVKYLWNIMDIAPPGSGERLGKKIILVRDADGANERVFSNDVRDLTNQGQGKHLIWISTNDP